MGHRLWMTFVPYLLLLGAAGVLSWLVTTTPQVTTLFTTMPEGLYLALGILFFLGFVLDTIAPRTAIPSFVWAILFGMALQPIFLPFTSHPIALAILVQLLAALVLFGGGVEVPFRSFTRYAGPIAALALVGTFLTALFFAMSLEWLAPLLGFSIPTVSLVILAAILSSIDPTAIIPALRSLSFRHPFIRDIAIAESALNDVTGSILTHFFIVVLLAAGNAPISSALEAFGVVLKRQTLDTLVLEVVWGVLVGLMLAWFLDRWQARLVARGRTLLDPALFLATPIIAFALGSIVGGSGFLAAFVAGLLFDARHPSREARRFFEIFVDKFIKPVIFVLLGALVPLPTLFQWAPLGLAIGLIFIFIIRPAVVFLTLLPWMVRSRTPGATTLSWRELMFLSFVRETGAIPAALLLIALAHHLPAAETMFALGMWVILVTLVVEPPLTPWLAHALGLVRPSSR